MLKKIRCPKCGLHAYVDKDIVYTSNPPLYSVHCPKCGDFYLNNCEVENQDNLSNKLTEGIIEECIKNNLSIDIRNNLYGNPHICLLFEGELIDSVELPLDEGIPVLNG